MMKQRQLCKTTMHLDILLPRKVTWFPASRHCGAVPKRQSQNDTIVLELALHRLTCPASFITNDSHMLIHASFGFVLTELDSDRANNRIIRERWKQQQSVEPYLVSNNAYIHCLMLESLGLMNEWRPVIIQHNTTVRSHSHYTRHSTEQHKGALI